MGQIIFYDIEFTNREGDDVLIRITDRKDYDYTGANDVTTIDLDAYAPGLELETFNTEENKFYPIIGQRATIRFKSTDTVNFSTFASGEDYRFWVRVTVNTTEIIFNGWLVMDDNQQAFLPSGQEVVLTATDGFGILKDVELSDFNGTVPSGKYRLIEIIAWCLRKTEGPYPSEGAAIYDGIKVAMNLFEFNHHSTVDNCPLNQTYVDIRSFQKPSGEFEDCHTVLTKILTSLMCRVCQYNNYWYILRIDEYKNSAFVIHNYQLGAVYIDRTLGATLDKDLEFDTIFIDAQTIQRIQRPYKSTIITHDLELPEEFFPNMFFERGTVIDDTTPTRTFDLDNWTLLNGEPGAYGVTDSTFYIERTYTAEDYIDEHYVVITPESGNSTLASTDQSYIESEGAGICEKDKFNASIDWRVMINPATASGGGQYFVMIFILHGDDGSYWQLGNEDINDPATPFKWWDTSNFTVATSAGQIDVTWTDIEDETQWMTLEVEAPPVPVTGTLTVRLHQINQITGTTDLVNVHYANFSFDYMPYLSGGYRDKSGVQFKMSSSLNYAKKFEDEFYLFDAPCKSYKGAMFYEDTGDYLLTSQWVDFAMEQYAIPDLLDFGYAFLHWQTNAMWNQNRLETWILNSFFYGLDVANDYVSPIHKYSMMSQSTPLSRMSFIILSMRQNWHDCTWQATIAEINDSDSVRQGGNSNGENFEFKYLEE